MQVVVFFSELTYQQEWIIIMVIFVVLNNFLISVPMVLGTIASQPVSPSLWFC